MRTSFHKVKYHVGAATALFISTKLMYGHPTYELVHFAEVCGTEAEKKQLDEREKSIWRHDIREWESKLLVSVCFDLEPELPQTFARELTQDWNGTEALEIRALHYCNDALNTTLPLRHHAKDIAHACVYLASEHIKQTLRTPDGTQQWYEHLCLDFSQMQAISYEILQCLNDNTHAAFVALRQKHLLTKPYTPRHVNGTARTVQTDDKSWRHTTGYNAEPHRFEVKSSGQDTGGRRSSWGSEPKPQPTTDKQNNGFVAHWSLNGEQGASNGGRKRSFDAGAGYGMVGGSGQSGSQSQGPPPWRDGSSTSLTGRSGVGGRGGGTGREEIRGGNHGGSHGESRGGSWGGDRGRNWGGSRGGYGNGNGPIRGEFGTGGPGGFQTPRSYAKMTYINSNKRRRESESSVQSAASDGSDEHNARKRQAMDPYRPPPTLATSPALPPKPLPYTSGPPSTAATSAWGTPSPVQTPVSTQFRQSGAGNGTQGVAWRDLGVDPSGDPGHDVTTWSGGSS
ncbi:hypothetical protein HK097_011303 [Rhizophlyctis rosea]|uniref:Uncharacterized protein n=1 Tax=Rhizophlyctis rosea TaxID=64517 RepID=A0AAD5X001_9FUNG|nr:hypothetical protein HK097_011303 [Rhizophlyctis rosea]